MSQLINDGGPAHPCTEANGCNSGCPGMSLRDHFAGEALKGLMARNWSDFEGTDEELITVWAKSSYYVADEMLKARESSTNG
jgi:hypothetical protein